VADSRIAANSGNAAFDAEALAMLRRAQPFPAPPENAGLLGELAIPIAFKMN
jgi:protein TonB